ncbi:MAG: phenylalanine--tRNA ligase subunit beta [Planctomycetes bacterium]|nr:phenylalanine--tRNA ligase subunit beta [Planctomycetota bacterium]
MPIINMPIDLLLRLVNAERQVLDGSQIVQTLDDMGVETEEVTVADVFACAACDNVMERTEAQGPPAHCPKCGADFRASPAGLRESGKAHVARLNMLAVRPDIFDPGGMARYMRGFLGVRTGLIEYPVSPPRITVQVDPRLGQDSSYRPAIACAVLRNMSLDHERIKLLMNLQEDLHWALGRDRKLASIGVYDLDKLDERGPAFRYRAVAPDELRFVPLGFSPSDPAANLTPREILQRHKTGQAYAHLLAKFSAFPLLTDGRGAVLSMPPIINSEATRVTMKTRQCFVDVTGMAQRTVDRALNILLSGLKEVMPGLEIEAVRIESSGAAIVTPDFRPANLSLDVPTAADTIGAPLDANTLTRLLERMGHGVSVERLAEGDRLRVLVPAWRNDVMHAIDLIEDAAIAYGYDNLVRRLVPTFTIGAPRAIEEQSIVVRSVFTGLGFHQVMTLTLTSEAAAFDEWGVPHDPRTVRIENPISSEQTICRVSLLPGLVDTLAINKQYDLPQHLFEVGDCSFLDPEAETGAREDRYVAAAMIGPHVGYADIRAVADAFFHEMGLNLEVRAADVPGFIPGRAASLHLAGEWVGTMGELHPRCLEAGGLRHAVAALEINLAAALAPQRV